MYERMESVSSQGGQRQQKTPHGADFQEETVNPSGPGGGPSASSAREEHPSREPEERQLMERVVSRHNMTRAYERYSSAGAIWLMEESPASFLEPVLGASAKLGTFPAHRIIDGIKRCSRGSYRNGTNIRGDMDVDLVVQLNPAHGRNRAVLSAIPGPSWFHETNPSRAVTGCLSAEASPITGIFPGATNPRWAGKSFAGLLQAHRWCFPGKGLIGYQDPKGNGHRTAGFG